MQHPLRKTATLTIEPADFELPHHVVSSEFPPTSVRALAAMSAVPRVLLTELERALSVRGVPLLFPPVKQLVQHVQPAYYAQGEVYIHPVEELVQFLYQWENVQQFNALTQTEKIAAIAHVVAREATLCGYASLVRETGKRWIIQDEPWTAFKARYPEPLVVIIYNDLDHKTSQTTADIENWLLMHATPKH